MIKITQQNVYNVRMVGRGRWTKKIQKHSTQVMAADPMSAMLKAAREAENTLTDIKITGINVPGHCPAVLILHLQPTK